MDDETLNTPWDPFYQYELIQIPASKSASIIMCGMKSMIHSQSSTVQYRYITRCDRDRRAAIFRRAFSNAFSWIKMCEFRLRFHWNLFLRFQLTILHHLLGEWLDADQATSHYLNQCWLVYWRIYASLGLNEVKHKNNIAWQNEPTGMFLMVVLHVVYWMPYWLWIPLFHTDITCFNMI